jgi:hypothetical protein
MRVRDADEARGASEGRHDCNWEEVVFYFFFFFVTLMVAALVFEELMEKGRKTPLKTKR